MTITAQIQSLNNINIPKKTGWEKTRSDLTTASANTPDEINRLLYTKNLVRCKKRDTFEPPDTIISTNVVDAPENIRNIFANSYQKYLNSFSPSGINKARLVDNFNEVFRVNIPRPPEEEAPADTEAEEQAPTKAAAAHGRHRARAAKKP